MRRFSSAVLTVLATCVVASSALAQWTTITFDQSYRTWYRSPSGTLVNDVLTLDPANFNNQIFANPHVQQNDSGEWLIMGYGDSNVGSTAVGDAIFVMKRLTSGAYVVPANAALTYGPAPMGSNWSDVGGLGAGAAIAKTTTATVGGYKYFAAVQVGKAPVVSGTFSIGWTSWAVSQDGETWYFVSQSGGLTSDPAQSVKIIRRADLSGQDDKFQHIAMAYNKYDDYFYVAMGWNSSWGGIKATWWRLKFDTANVYGIPYNSGAGTYEIQILNNSTFVNTVISNPSLGTGVSNGLITDYFDAWQSEAQSPKSIAPVNAGAQNAMDLVLLYKQDGSFDSMLFIYPLESDPTKIYYVKGTLPQTSTGMFVWSTGQMLNLSVLSSQPNGASYSTCGAGGFSVSVTQSGWQANGAPNLFGFAGTWRQDLYQANPGGCGVQSQGLLPLHFTLN